MVVVTPEEWGELTGDIKHIKKAVDEQAKATKELPCNQRENNPISRIEVIEKQMGWTQKLGYAIVGLVLAATAAITKFFGLMGSEK